MRTLAPALLLAFAAALPGCSPHRAEAPLPAAERAAGEEPQAAVAVARSRSGMVVAGHFEAAEIGREILRRGGGAIDAAVAVSFALAVAEPYGSGLGGKLMLLHHEAESGEITAVDAMDAAPAGLAVEAFLALPRERRIEGWGAVAVPGLVAGMHAAHERWGRLEWASAVRPAAELARRGSVVLPAGRVFFERRLPRLEVSAEARRLFLPAGRLPAPGGRLANPDLARTLETIAAEGAAGFYRGRVAAAVAAASRRGGGWLREPDLAAYEARFREPLGVEVGGYTVLGSPPPTTGGATVLAALAALADAEWSGDSVLEAGNLDRVGTVLRRLYPEVQRRIADVPGARAAFGELLSAASGPPEPAARAGGSGPEGTSTTHFVVADSAGNVASVTQSLSHHFGAGVVAEGTGVLFNNTMKNFATGDPGSVNFVAPSKRPRSTIAPTLVLRGGVPVLALGVPGGQRIPTATLQVLLDHLVFGAPLAEAIARPRAHLRRPLRADEPENLFELEEYDPALAAELEALGWAVEVNRDRETFGGFCAVQILEPGTFLGLADQRRTNAARGL